MKIGEVSFMNEEVNTVNAANDVNAVANIPENYKPISMWGYFGYEILFSIPCIGFIILLVFAFGGTQNVNLKNFARSYFCFMIIFVVLFMIMMAAGVGSAISGM